MKKKTTMADLTEDILEDIFSRLRPRYISRGRCVCRQWRRLMTGNRFIQSHFRRSNLKNPNLMLRSYNESVISVIDLDDLYEESLNLKLDLGLPENEELPVVFVGSCNGFICLLYQRLYMSMFNPSTGEHDKIKFPELDYGEVININMGLGYDCINKQFKVVLIFEEKNGDMGAMLYTLHSGSWTRLRDPPSRCFHHTPFESYYPDYVTQAAYVNGFMHWDGSTEPWERNTIITFNFSTNRFGEFVWPDIREGYYSKVLWQLEGCLAACVSYANECVDVWKMIQHAVPGTWTKIFSIRQLDICVAFKMLQPLACINDGNILLQVDSRRLVLYDPVKKDYTVVFDVAGNKFVALTYVDSLASLTVPPDEIVVEAQ